MVVAAAAVVADAEETADMRSVQEIVDLASAYYGSAVLFAAIDCGVFEKVEAGTLDTSCRGMRLLADACVAEGPLEMLVQPLNQAVCQWVEHTSELL